MEDITKTFKAHEKIGQIAMEQFRNKVIDILDIKEKSSASIVNKMNYSIENIKKEIYFSNFDISKILTKLRNKTLLKIKHDISNLFLAEEAVFDNFAKQLGIEEFKIIIQNEKSIFKEKIDKIELEEENNKNSNSITLEGAKNNIRSIFLEKIDLDFLENAAIEKLKNTENNQKIEEKISLKTVLYKTSNSVKEFIKSTEDYKEPFKNLELLTLINKQTLLLQRTIKDLQSTIKNLKEKFNSEITTLNSESCSKNYLETLNKISGALCNIYS